MTDRSNTGGGGMTGATGDLTTDDARREFVPGELREAADPLHHADVTAAQASAAPAQQGDTGDPGYSPDEGLPTQAPRDDGYGSEHGLSPSDPAYRMERHPDHAPSAKPAGTQHREPRAGGDEIVEREERF